MTGESTALVQVLEWMPLPDGIESCQGDGATNVTQRRGNVHSIGYFLPAWRVLPRQVHGNRISIREDLSH